VITEAVVRVILHCSRCNTRFTDDFEDLGAVILWDPKKVAETFSPGREPWDDVQGWVQIGGRVLCFDCWTWSEDDDEKAVELPPLSATEDAKLNRERAGYTSAEALERVLHKASTAVAL
jgi:hypothetical protein